MEKRGDKSIKTKSSKFDEGLPDSIKEKQYVTKQVDTSISILESPENDVVLESLLFLSKYADLKLSNLTYLQQKGITTKILNLLNRNICILRLSLRLLSVLLEKTQIIYELDQDIYNDKVLEISNLYINHKDQYVREFCLGIMSKLARSCRITCLVFKAELFKPILETIRTSQTPSLLAAVLSLLNHLLDSPPALGNLILSPNFDVKAVIAHIYNDNKAVAEKAYEVILKITSKDIKAFQKMFRDNQLVEKMIQVLMDAGKKNFHSYAVRIIQNCANSQETNSYFVRSIQFLAFSQWSKTCADEYLISAADILEKLSNIDSVKQILYDLSVEESIILLLRSKEKLVLNKASKAITNMTVHKYCCEDMLQPNVVKSLVDILNRKDDTIDPYNEVALETIYSFFIRSTRALPMLYANDIIPILLKYFTKSSELVEESFLRVTDMLYKYSLISEYQQSVIGESFFEKLFQSAVCDPDDSAALALEILVHFIGNKTFNNIFLTKNGPALLLERLKSNSSPKLMRFILLFIHSSMLVTELPTEFLKSNILGVFKSLPETVLSRAPIIDTITTLVYNVHLPTKFHKTGKLDLTNKLGNKFYLIQGRPITPFPFIEILEAQRVCPISTIYIVDYTYEVKKPGSFGTSLSKVSKATLRSSDNLSSTNQCTTFGEISPDTYLPYYIKHVEEGIQPEWTLEPQVDFLAKYVDEVLCGPIENDTTPGKLHNFKVHLENLKFKLGNNIIPIGFLRLGFHCERALLFKAIADRVNIPCSLQQRNRVYWNEIALLQNTETGHILRFYLVDLMENIGRLLEIGSKEANKYLNISAQ